MSRGRLERLDRRDDDDVAAGGLEVADQRVERRLRSSLSITLAKSLTGAVSSAAASARSASAAPATIRRSSAAPHAVADQALRSRTGVIRRRHDRRNPTSRSIAVEIRRETACTASTAASLSASASASRSPTTCASSPMRLRARNRRARPSSSAVQPVQPREMAEQRGKSRRRLAHERVDLAGRPRAFEVVLTQVEQVTLDLHFAGAPQIVGSDGEAVERIAAIDDVVVRDESRRTRSETRRASARSRSRVSRSGVATPARCQTAARSAQALRSSSVSDVTSARLGTGP